MGDPHAVARGLADEMHRHVQDTDKRQDRLFRLLSLGGLFCSVLAG